MSNALGLFYNWDEEKIIGWKFALTWKYWGVPSSNNLSTKISGRRSTFASGTCLSTSGILYSWKKDKDRRKGKCRRCCSGDRIYSIPCPECCFALGQFLKNRMNWFLSLNHPGAIHPILFFKSSQCKIACAAGNWINSVPQTAATTIAFFSIIFLLQCCTPYLTAADAMRIAVSLSLVSQLLLLLLPPAANSATDWPVFFEHLG